MDYILVTLLMFTGIFLILLVLMQRGRGGGLAGAFGGMGGQSAFGTKAGDVFTKITVGAAVIWVLLAGASIHALRPPSSFDPGEDTKGPSASSGDDESIPTSDGKADDDAEKDETDSGEDAVQSDSGDLKSLIKAVEESKGSEETDKSKAGSGETESKPAGDSKTNSSGDKEKSSSPEDQKSETPKAAPELPQTGGDKSEDAKPTDKKSADEQKPKSDENGKDESQGE